MIVWQCDGSWAPSAPSLRGLSKIYLIFDWGSVLNSNDTPSVTAIAVPAACRRLRFAYPLHKGAFGALHI